MAISIVTERLRMRQWKESDFLPFFKLNSDPEVMEFFPTLLSRDESDEMATEIQRRISKNGWGFWAVEELNSREFVGFVGLNQPTYDLPFNPCVEVGWRLAREYWGRGYASEAGRSALKFAFDSLLLNEVVSFTSLLNKRSEAVMLRLGMTDSHENFNHPQVSPQSQLCEHVLYRISRERWQELHP